MNLINFILYLILNFYLFYSKNICLNNFIFFLNEIKQKEILIIEINNFHGECIPGYIKYFNILGYRNIELLITKEHYNENILDFSHFKIKIKILLFSQNEINKFISLGICNFYKVCFFNTLDMGTKIIRKYMNSKHKFKSIFVLHNKNNFKKRDIIYNDIVVLKKFKKNYPFYEVNPHYFGEYEYHHKSKIINLVTAGNYSNRKKNYNLLINSIFKLISNNIFNFHIIIIGNHYQKLKNLIVKKNLTEYVTFTGRIPYSLMYKLISKSDYFIPLLDPKYQKQYLKLQSSGSFQLSYGLNIPMIIEKTFANFYNFNKNNSIIYNRNDDFYNKLNYAINLSENEYKKIKEGLKLTAKEIEINSLENLKKILSK